MEGHCISTLDTYDKRRTCSSEALFTDCLVTDGKRWRSKHTLVTTNHSVERLLCLARTVELSGRCGWRDGELAGYPPLIERIRDLIGECRLASNSRRPEAPPLVTVVPAYCDHLMPPTQPGGGDDTAHAIQLAATISAPFLAPLLREYERVQIYNRVAKNASESSAGLAAVVEVDCAWPRPDRVQSRF